jgi:hypothetical protein
MMDCTLMGATQNAQSKDSALAPQLKENRLTLSFFLTRACARAIQSSRVIPV